MNNSISFLIVEKSSISNINVSINSLAKKIEHEQIQKIKLADGKYFYQLTLSKIKWKLIMELFVKRDKESLLYMINNISYVVDFEENYTGY